MATSKQKPIFEKPLPNIHKIVLAKNMAEASITINDIVFMSLTSELKREAELAMCNQVGSIGEFLSAALQPLESLAIITSYR
ncbi:hypothetical protein SLE2022_347810 [Rubroshorea leprosula]